MELDLKCTYLCKTENNSSLLSFTVQRNVSAVSDKGVDVRLNDGLPLAAAALRDMMFGMRMGESLNPYSCVDT